MTATFHESDQSWFYQIFSELDRVWPEQSILTSSIPESSWKHAFS